MANLPEPDHSRPLSSAASPFGSPFADKLKPPSSPSESGKSGGAAVSCASAQQVGDLAISLSPLACQPFASKSGITFTCDCCKRLCPMSEHVQKGYQSWCKSDNRSYTSLSARWQRNPKLKQWWTKLSPVHKVHWFTKWQPLNGKARFDAIIYLETAVESMEELNDEIDSWITWRKFKIEGKLLGLSDADISAEWGETIRSNRANCLFRRGEWLVPVFDGVERRVRQRTANEIQSIRQSQCQDDDELRRLVESGRQNLQRFSSGVATPACLGQLADTPRVQSRPEDQPVLPKARDVAGEQISREACSCRCHMSLHTCIIRPNVFYVGVLLWESVSTFSA